MQFFFPDSQDQICPYYDFVADEYPPHRVRQRDDIYAHEVLRGPPVDGILVSKAMVDGVPNRASRYSLSQRHRLYRVGVQEFFRLRQRNGSSLLAMGDCGAFSYVQEDEPPYTADEVIDFYDECNMDLGVSPDHVILAFRVDAGEPDPDWVRRRELTLSLAEDFFSRHRARDCTFVPVGAAQGWDAESMAESVRDLQRIGYRRIAVGGLVPLRTPEIMACLSAIDRVRDPDTQLHLLGVTRCEHVHGFARFGATSFDSTSPFRQAFMDESDNYWTIDGAFTALRVPQVDANPSLKRRIRAGQIDQGEAQRLEKDCLEALRAFDRDKATPEEALYALRAYEQLHDERNDHTEAYKEMLEARPWRTCSCGICEHVGIDVAIFRGTERNKRRGFHNIRAFRERLDRALGTTSSSNASSEGT